MKQQILKASRRLPVRIVAPILMVNMLVLGVVGAVLVAWTGRTGIESLEKRFQVVADTVARNAELPILAADDESLYRVLESVEELPEVIEASALDPQGKLIRRYRRVDVPESPEDVIRISRNVTTIPSDWEDFESGSSQEDSDPALLQIGRVDLLISSAMARAETRKIQAIIFGAWALLLIAGVGTGWMIARKVGRPLEALVKATRDVAAGDLSVRLPPSSNDEIGDLTRSFSAMAADLESFQEALLENQAQLEERVRERTAELERAQAQLIGSERLSAVGQMVAGVAHELNNPLAVVLGYSSLLRREFDPEKAEQKLDHIADAADRARKIVTNLMTFARKQESERGPVQINEIVESTLQLRDYELRDAGIRVVSRLEPELAIVNADMHQLQQVLLNLLINAQQSIVESGVGSTIEVVTRNLGDEILMIVRDDGPGMPADVQARVFEPFFTTKDVGAGTGLGLSIVYGIVSDHGGTIQVDSEPGYARFVMRLPAREIPESLRPSRRAEDGPPTVHPERRLLVVDDNPEILEFVSEALEMLDVEVIQALGGRAALDSLGSGERYDAVLSDMRMPDVDGRQVYEFVRENRPELTDRFIFVTGDVANERSIEFIQRTGCDLLDKPFTVRALWDVVEAKLNSLQD